MTIHFEPPAPVWTLRAPVGPSELVRVMQTYSVSAPLAQMIRARGLKPEYLSPELTLTPNPALHLAARRVVSAAERGLRIRIHGDYDADGVTATSVLVLGLRALGANVHGFIPHRLNEGYGVHPDKVDEHAGACDLLITVDCGVTNVQEVRDLITRGVEVIVTDHHAPGPDFPDCLVVHPALTPDYDPERHNLTGAGVAYHLLWAVRQAMGQPEPREYADLATIGIIADVAPLLGENRALVQAGLKQLPYSVHAGLRTLMGHKKLDAPTARDVAFVIAPRINAAGRMGEADIALKLLTTGSPGEADTLATYLEIRNGERRTLQDRMFKEALSLVDPADPAIVVTRDDWHAGVMGIVASKLLERYYKPVYIIAQGKGSVRSTPGISAVQGLRVSHDLLNRYGGHMGAAGFSMDETRLEAFRDRIHGYARTFPRPVPSVTLDGPLPLGAFTRDLYDLESGLEPYGEGLARPLWWLRAPLTGARMVGKTASTLQFRAGHLKGVKYDGSIPREGLHDLAVNVQLNSWMNRENVELFATALREPGTLDLLGEPCPDLKPLPRLNPREATQHLHAGAGAYASGAVLTYLQSQVPGLRLSAETDSPSGELILYALPPEAVLRAWLQLPDLNLSFAFGPKTLDELESAARAPTGPLQAPQPWLQGALARQAADAYSRFTFAQLYRALNDEGFTRAVHQFVGAPGPAVAGPELAHAVAD